ncbi:hypothetical protein PUMCH_002065 [Australozyma saopauloensis]|uniref:Uncharacterized protein n=1 Tax=Australozyma saopauloensis TaxID=291208 RepID=A0AAX4H937_9ASCO|nr:hypothetical protein PUMCH_002065 [[Candida] saopauloensis]
MRFSTPKMLSPLVLEDTSSSTQNVDGLRHWSSLHDIPELLLVFNRLVRVSSHVLDVSTHERGRLSPPEVTYTCSKESTGETRKDLVLSWHLLEASRQNSHVGCTNSPECVPAIVFLSQVGDHAFGCDSDGSKSSEGQRQAELESSSSPNVQPCVCTESCVGSESQHLECSLWGVNRFPLGVSAGIAEVDKWVWPLVGGVRETSTRFFGHGVCDGVGPKLGVVQLREPIKTSEKVSIVCSTSVHPVVGGREGGSEVNATR